MTSAIKFKILLATVFFGFTVTCVQSAGLASADDEEFPFVEAEGILQAAFAADGPGVVAIVTKNNKTVFIAGQGLANIETGTPITRDTVFRMGSITKQFSAATIMLLVEEGLIDLDAPIRTYLPDYPEPGATVSVRQLLNHTSGIPSYTAIPGVMAPENTVRELSTEQIIAIFRDKPLEFTPGENWSYSNSGYILVGALIEAVTGQSWVQVVKDRIGDPLAMNSLDSGVVEADVTQMAIGYTGQRKPEISQPIHMSYPGASGELISTVQDLADWANALHDGDVVSPDSYAQMIAPTQIGLSRTIPYGFGLVTQDFHERRVIGHNGGIFGFLAESLYFPEEDIFVAVMTNTDSPSQSPEIIARKLAELAFQRN